MTLREKLEQFHEHFKNLEEFQGWPSHADVDSIKALIDVALAAEKFGTGDPDWPVGEALSRLDKALE